jgi:adenosylcobinamide-GDP ribazoletransferase
LLVLLAAGAVVVPGRPWVGMLAVVTAALAVIILSAHTQRRLGGLTGDVLGAASELASTAVLVVCAAG